MYSVTVMTSEESGSSQPDPIPPELAPPQKPSSVAVIVIAVIAGVLVVGIAIVGVMAALAIFGVRRYVSEAKSAEGRNVVMVIARGVVACSAREAAAPALPPSTEPIPRALASISGRKYLAGTGEWTAGSWACIGYTQSDPHYFQYRWVKQSDTSGVVRAVADLDGDGQVDRQFEVDVSCTGSDPVLECGTGAVREVR
jgi:hypothetical protein